MFDQTKLRRDIDAVRESIQLASVDLATAYAPDDRRSLVEHIGILLSELGDLVRQAESLGTVPNDCPYGVGDRVEHKLFGPGTVTAVSSRTASPDLSSPTGTRDAGWSITVRWRDEGRGESGVAHWALKPIAKD